MSTLLFYGKRPIVVVPANEGADKDDNDVANPDFIPPTYNLDTPCPSDMDPSAKRKCMQSALELEDDEGDDDDDDYHYAKGPTKKGKVDLDNQALPNTSTFPYDDLCGYPALHGISELPSIDDYWVMETRVPQVANLMSSKRFRLMRRLVHFTDNTQIPGTIDRFFKVFKATVQPPGNISRTSPDKWGFKLFARSSEDGFIHDLVLYKGKTMLEAHGVPMNTMSSSTTTANFADNFFSSLEIVCYLKDKNCWYTGTARDNRIGKKKAVPHGMHDCVTSDDGILALRLKDNKVVTLLSDLGVEKEQVSCPAVIKSYNANMGGIDNSDMLVHLYRIPMKSKRWYMQMFANAVDVSLTNAWIITSDDVPKPVLGHRSHTPDASERFDMSLTCFRLHQLQELQQEGNNIEVKCFLQGL
ncbi:hypothetical protein ABG768_021687 [Culter alburnus]|uniref:PiggyBac transposable element-derived protein domain-containing protein n=1 Tax=Culter alburnus TaxID=194366 RepID=A0AAW2ASM7_CULAL